MNSHPIGFFDSGVGGTSIWKEVTDLLPEESTIYIADSANAPYGSKPEAEILHLSKVHTEFLIQQNCKLIVVACNTATTNAIKQLRNTYDIPFVGIEPAIKPAALQTQTYKIGILATKGTLSSALFHNTVFNHAQHIKVIEQNGEGLVQHIEAGDLSSEALKKLLKKHLQPMIEADIDYIVLGCTHYPYLIPLLKTMLPKHIKIIDSGRAVARQTLAKLNELNIKNTCKNPDAKHRFYSTAHLATLKYFVGETPNSTFLNL